MLDFGAFVNIVPGKDGLVHISQISNERVEKVSDNLKEGDIVKVKVIEVDKQGRIRLSMKAAGRRGRKANRRRSNAVAGGTAGRVMRAGRFSCRMDCVAHSNGSAALRPTAATGRQRNPILELTQMQAIEITQPGAPEVLN